MELRVISQLLTLKNFVSLLNSMNECWPFVCDVAEMTDSLFIMGT